MKSGEELEIDSSYEFILYSPKNPISEKLIEQVEMTETLDQLAALFEGFPRLFGFDTASLIVVKEGNLRLLKQRIFTSMPEVKRLKLTSSNTSGLSKFLEQINDGDDFFSFEGISSSSKVSRDIGINSNSGVALCIEYPSGLSIKAILNIAKSKNAAKKLFLDQQYDLRGLFSIFCDTFVYFSSVGLQPVPILNELEARFLRCVAVKEDPADALNLNYAYGSSKNVQTSIVRKFGVNSIHQAVAIAIKHNLLDNLNYRVDEIVHAQSKLNGFDGSLYVE